MLSHAVRNGNSGDKEEIKIEVKDKYSKLINA